MMISEPVKNFKRGWGCKIFGSSTVHFFERDGVGLMRSVCGKVSDIPARYVFSAIVADDKCKLCLKKVPENEISDHGGPGIFSLKGRQEQ